MLVYRETSQLQQNKKKSLERYKK